MSGSARGPLAAWLGWAAVAAAAVAAVLALPALAQEEPVETATQGDPRLGEVLYAQYCAMCHGADGQGAPIPGGEGAVGPPVTDVSPAYVELVLRTRRMPPGDPLGRSRGPLQFDEEQQAGVVAYLVERFDIEGEVETPAEGDAARGREVFATHCAACHGSTGAGGIVGGGGGGGGVLAGGGSVTPNLVGLDARSVALAIRVGPFQMPRFSAEQVPDEEVGDIAAFLDEVADEPTTLLGFAELNPVFASGFVFFLALAVLLSCLWLGGRVALFPDRADHAEQDQPTAGDASEREGT